MSIALVAIGRSQLLLRPVEHLVAQGHRLAAVVTCPANPEHDASPVDFERLSSEVGAPFFCTPSLNDPALQHAIACSEPAMGITANWPYIMPPSFLDSFSLGLLNLHVGQLPDYKGNASVNWAILRGEDHVFVDVHRVTPQLDAGDVLARHRVSLADDVYVGDVLRESQEVAPSLFAQAVHSRLTAPDSFVVKGSAEGLRCFPRLPQDGLIDWTQPAIQVARLVRASSRPYPGAYSFLTGRRVTVWRAKAVVDDSFLAQPGHVIGRDAARGTLRVACGQGVLDLEEVEVDGTAVRSTELTRSIRARFGGSVTR
jgi:methionyl-tRNA formyltransferase